MVNGNEYPYSFVQLRDNPSVISPSCDDELLAEWGVYQFKLLFLIMMQSLGRRLIRWDAE